MDVNFRTLDLNLLRVFDEVMAERNLTRAARNLSLTQPAVSNALRRLREVLGDDLLRRSGAGTGSEVWRGGQQESASELRKDPSVELPLSRG